MRNARYVVTTVAAAMLAACGGSQPPIGAPGASPQGTAIARPESAAVPHAILHHGLPASYYQVLYRFRYRGEHGRQPQASLINVNGTLYGTTTIGGSGCTYGCGTVFSVTTTGRQKVLYRFAGARYDDGADPTANLINVKGTLYGTTTAGGGYSCGSAGCGTVFSVTRNGTEKVLYRFVGGPADGASPSSSLVNVKGTLYGTTTAGGASGHGTVFSVTMTGKEKVLYSFGGSPDGDAPFAGLVNINGTLYGTTYSGGGSECLSSGCGTVFGVTTTGTEKVLYSFAGGSDGGNPFAGLINVGNTLYGTTRVGGGSGCDVGCGTVFSVTTNGTEKVLYSFAGGSDGSGPLGGLINVKGTLYGTTEYGGSGCRGIGCGTIFSVTTTGTKNGLYSFGGGDEGSDPLASLIEVNRTLYGTTNNYWSACRYRGDCGTVFAFTP